MENRKSSVFKKRALKRIKGIHKLSDRYNKLVHKRHQDRLLELMRSHINEIEELVARKDKHALVETGDLAVLCFELLLEKNVSMEKILLLCFDRYERKLNGLLQEAKNKKRFLKIPRK